VIWRVVFKAEFVQDLTQKLDACLLSNSTDYLQWDWERMAADEMSDRPDRSVVNLIDFLVTGFGGFKKYKYDRLLFEVLANQAVPEAADKLISYLGDRDRAGFAAQGLTKHHNSEKAAGAIVWKLKDALIFRPTLITYRDGITLSHWVFMIEALKEIGYPGPDVLRILQDLSDQAGDSSIRRDAKEALDTLKAKG